MNQYKTTSLEHLEKMVDISPIEEREELLVASDLTKNQRHFTISREKIGYMVISFIIALGLKSYMNQQQQNASKPQEPLSVLSSADELWKKAVLLEKTP